MAFADELREAGASRIAILHEFLSQHNPKEERIHAFVEGYEDPLLYRNRLNEYAGQRPVYMYPCQGKRRLYDAFAQVTAHTGKYKHTLFFADKDLEDILPETYVRDQRIFTTEYYAIENYLVCGEVIRRIFRDFITIKGCVLPVALERIEVRFEEELKAFHELMTPIVAWIVCVRRRGLRPNLQNVKLQNVFNTDDELRIRRLPGSIQYLCRVSGIPNNPEIWSDLRNVIRDLRKRDPKTFVRGKFETWFLVQFFKKALEQLDAAAQALSGRVEVPVMIERRNAIALLAGLSPFPKPLDSFLKGHLTIPPLPEAPVNPGESSSGDASNGTVQA